MNFVKSAIITFGSKLIMFGLSLTVGVLIARALGAVGRGQYALYYTLTMLGMVFSKTGVEVAAMYHISIEEDNILEIVGTCLVTGLVVSSVVSCILYLYFSISGKILFPGFMQFGIYCAMIAIPNMLFCIYARLLLLGRKKIISFNTLNWISQIVMLIGVIIVLYTKTTVNNIILVHIISLLFNSFIALILLKRANIFSLRFKRLIFKKLIRYGFPTAIGNICKNLVLKVDILILGYLSGDASVGFYSIAVGLSEKLFLLPNSLQSLIVHWVASEKDKHFIEKVYKNLCYILSFGALILVIVSGPAIKILYPGFEPAIPVTYILIPATLMFSMYTIMAGYVLGSAHTKDYLFFNAAALVMNIVLNLLLIPKLGMQGAAIATLVSYGFLNIAVIVFYFRTSKSTLRSLLIPNRIDILQYKSLLARFSSSKMD